MKKRTLRKTIKMKNILLGILAVAFLFTTSCKKNNTITGSWTFDGTTYNANSSSVVTGSFLTASNLTSSDSATYGTLQVDFDGYALPTKSGTYTIVGTTYPAAANQVSIGVTTNGGLNSNNTLADTKTYQSTGTSGTVTLAVTVSGGKITVSGSNIQMHNVNNPADTGSLTFNISH